MTQAQFMTHVAGFTSTKYVDGGKRSMMVVYYKGFKIVGEVTLLYTRGKVTQRLYVTY